MKHREETMDRVRLDDLEVDLTRRRFRRHAHWRPIEGLSFRLLEVLIQNGPGPVSRRELTAAVWGDVVVDPATLTQRVRLLRRTLGGAGYVAAVKGYGYRLGVPVRPIAEDDSGPRPRWPRPGRLAMGLALSAPAVAVVVAVLVPGVPHTIAHRLAHLVGL